MNRELKLTICIPSYSRIHKVTQTVLLLLPQLKNFSCKIIILDNASPHQYEPQLRDNPDIELAIRRGELTIHRNCSNIGMSANFLRAFELASSEWLWLLSDDDFVEPHALTQVMCSIEDADNDFGFIKFGSVSNSSIADKNVLNSFENFIDRNALSRREFYDFIFISNGIYRVRVFRKYLDVGYLHAHTYIPHFMMLASYMVDRGKIKLVSGALVNYIVPSLGYSYGLLAGLGVGGPKSILFKSSKKYAQRFYGLFFPYNDFKVIVDLYFHCRQTASVEVYKYHTRNYVHQISVARGRFQIEAVKFVAFLGRSQRLFESCVSILGVVSPKLRRHITEIKLRYANP